MFVFQFNDDSFVCVCYMIILVAMDTTDRCAGELLLLKLISCQLDCLKA